MTKNLAVFDFDWTIVDDNSDTAVMARHKVPHELRQLHRTDGWTAFMQGIFKFLYDHNTFEPQIATIIKRIPPVTGMCEFIKKLNDELNYDVIVISDSNSYFINLWLKEHNLDGHVMKVFTNPAQFVDGLLTIKMYHLQDTCKLSTKNLCKGQIMEDFIKEQLKNGVKYGKVVYCGDGMNDFCPILRLGEDDIACVRNKFKCVDLVMKAKKGESFDEEGLPYTVKAKVCRWDTGNDILEFVLNDGK